MKQREPLKVGTKIKFVGPFLDSGIPEKAAFSRGIRETVKDYDPETEKVTLETGAVIHRRQITHVLKRKPQPEKQERERRRGHWDGNWMVELFPGELPISKDAVIKAFDDFASDPWALSGTLKALGFPVEDK